MSHTSFAFLVLEYVPFQFYNEVNHCSTVGSAAWGSIGTVEHRQKYKLYIYSVYHFFELFCHIFTGIMNYTDWSDILGKRSKLKA